MITKVISGGQTGADRAGLQCAKDLGIETGGYIPKGFRTENGNELHLGNQFGLIETQSEFYPERTHLNVQSSDGTVLFGNTYSKGSKLTISLCVASKKPHVYNPTSAYLAWWIKKLDIKTLNVAGNRASKNPNVYAQTYSTLKQAIQILQREW